MPDKKPFFIFPWEKPFLPALKDFVQERSGGLPASALLIVPHNRPWQYFSALYAKDGKPCILPKMMPISEVITIWRGQVADKPAHIATSLEQAGLLFQCARALSTTDQILAARLGKMDMEKFLPWGLRLATLLEEMLTHGVEVKDLGNLEGEVEQPAAGLLGALGRICSMYCERLQADKWTTPGLDNLLARQAAQNIPHILCPAPNRPVFIAGFYALNGTEESLFKSLWQSGAYICLHSDAAISAGQTPHPACLEHSAWIRRWRAQPACACKTRHSPSSPRISFFAGYDVHSQLKELPRRLAGNEESTAIVLAQPDMLMPTLHHLPDKNVNISMGYPIDRTPLANLFEEIFHLQETRVEQNGIFKYYWRDLLKLLRQPFLNMLATPAHVSLRFALKKMDDKIRVREKYIDIDAIFNPVAAKLDNDLASLLKECLNVMVKKPAAMDSIASMADCMRAILTFLINHGGQIWRRFPLDAEAAAHLRNNVLNTLESSELIANDKFSMPVLHAILRQLLAGERVPFEAFPLVGLQVLGMLETRLLHFDRVFILGASDDVLPGSPEQNPLLPDSLRAMIGLPDSRKRESVMAHNLFRLCAGASEAQFFWEEGVSHSGLFDGKKARSRFIEQLIWQQESDAGILFTPGTAPLFAAKATVHANNSSPQALAKTPAITQALAAFLQKPVSPSRLDEYMDCPLRFARKNLLHLSPLREVGEGDDPPQVGNCIHEALRDFYAPFLNKSVKKSDLDEERLIQCFSEQLNARNLRDILPAASFFMLDMAGRLRLAQYLQAQPEETFVAALEQNLRAAINTSSGQFEFYGIIDRLDKRDGRHVLIDYKTGSLKKPSSHFWEEEDFFKILEVNTGVEPGDLSLLEALRDKISSLQLPFYVTMLHSLGGYDIGDAVLVDLKDTCAETSIFSQKALERIDETVSKCAIIVDFVLSHLHNCQNFSASEGKTCAYCEFSGLCGFFSA